MPLFSCLRLSLAGVLLLMPAACSLDEDKGGSGKGDGGSGSAVPLFLGEVPAPESRDWSFESGVEKSASGTLNPLLFDTEKTPLRFPGSRIRLNLFAGSKSTAVVDHARKTRDGFAARGRIEGIEGAGFVATTHGGTLTAVVRLGTEGTFRVESGADGRHRAIRMNAFEPGELQHPVPQASGAALAEAAPLPREAAGTTRTMKIMVMYTAAAAAGAGGVSALNSAIETAVEEANEAYANSGIDAQLDLVHTEQVAYTEPNNMSTDLGRLQNASDGYMDNVHALRNTHEADLVTLVTETSGGSYAGLGYIMRPAGSWFAPYAFNVVMRSYLVGYYVLAHEVGHNLGCAHDRGNSSSSGSYSYSYGWRFTGTDNVQYRTVMAYAPGLRIPYFSNPAIRYLGRPTGRTTDNNARTINTNSAILAAFRGSNTAPAVSLSVPGGRSAFGGPTNLVLQADVDDDLGIDSVVFFSGTTRLGVDKATPYLFPWPVVPAGAYTLTARAYDKGGLTGNSAGLAVTVGSSGLSAPWNDAFLGLKGMPGSASHSGGTYTLVSGGADLAGAKDGGQFAYRTLAGNGTLKARIVSVQNTGATAKAGVMLRDTLSTGGRMFFAGLLANGTAKVLRRPTRNTAMGTLLTRPLSLPYHLSLIRKGNTVAAFASPDGSNWTYLRHAALTPTASLFGLAATGGDTASDHTATFSHVSVDTGANFPPQVTLSGPLEGRTFAAGAEIALTAAASDLDGIADIAAVKFYNGATLLATDNLTPFALAWTAVSGAANLRAEAEDLAGNVTASDTLSITVNAAGAGTVWPSKDATVRNGSFAGTNYGTSGVLTVKENASAGQTFHSYLVFPLSGQATVSAATLRLYGRITAAGSVTVRVYAVTDTSWKESGSGSLRWNNRPVLGSLLGTATFNSIDRSWKTVNVGTYTAGRKSAGAAFVGYALVGAASTTVSAQITSRNAGINAGRPELVLAP